MFISDVSIKHPVFATMMMVTLVVLGVVAYQRLAIDEYPDESLDDHFSGMSGKVLNGRFTLNGVDFVCLDGGPLFTFNESISLVVTCADQAEIDAYWSKLSHVPESEQCGWCKDRFGVSWQIVPANMDELTSRPEQVQVMMQQKKIVIDELVKEALRRGQTAPKYHALTRPSRAEGEATGRAIALAEMARVPIYIVHLSAADALEKVKHARDMGLPAYAETCPQYLFLSYDNYEEPGFEGAKYVMSPPLREKWHQDVLWNPQPIDMPLQVFRGLLVERRQQPDIALGHLDQEPGARRRGLADPAQMGVVAEAFRVELVNGFRS